MRTLEEEISYCEAKGFHRDTIELSTMIVWLHAQRLAYAEGVKVERERAAKKVDQYVRACEQTGNHSGRDVAEDCAAAIRKGEEVK